MRWVVRDLTGADGRPLNAFEPRVLLDLLDIFVADSHSRLFGQKLLDQIFGLGINFRIREVNFMALLNVMVGFKIRSTLEGS